MLDEFVHFKDKNKYVPVADSNYVRFRTCSRKKVYIRQIDAVNTLHKLHGVNPKHMHVYNCPFCHFYHLGHNRNGK